MAPRSYDEKRNFPRMLIDHKLSFSLVGESGLSEGSCTNLSARGVLFTSLRAVAVGAQININITPFKAVVVPLNASAEVLRVEQEEHLGVYRIAARITQMR